MFLGKFYYKLQDKDRISLPKKFRQKNKNWVITRGLDGCLFIFKQDNFKQEINKLAQRSFTKKANRDLMRIMANEAEEIQADNNGRVHLPKYLINFAQLKKDLVVVGSFNRIEIWDQTKYHHYVEQLENKAEIIAEHVDVE
ncbi:MAG: division/cell wall cluster transcriptional repressor MraZ [Patescibacteria group bacterium]|nr:division/cell wall cluster transcriptional repressor MraZ [Patescibacteria group bacterium]